MTDKGVSLLLSGGVGGAKLAYGMASIMSGEELVIVANTGDDFDHLGLRICPDIDTLAYTLSGLSDTVRGWGRADETWHFMEALGSLGGEDWFNLGDADMALHVVRTQLLRHGETITEVTRKICDRLGVAPTILPMSDDHVATLVDTVQGRLAFQTYFVREQCMPHVKGFVFAGQSQAQVNPSIRRLFDQGCVDSVIIAPSNPYVSIDPILGIPGFREILKTFNGPVIGVSPIVGGKAIKGPTAKMMAELGIECNAQSIAAHYRDVLDGLLIDEVDAGMASGVSELGIACRTAQTVMTSAEDKVAVAMACQAFVHDLAAAKA